MKIGKLRVPSSDLSKRVLTEVDFEHRLEAGYFLFSWEDKYLMIAFLYFSKSLKFR